MIKTKQYFFKKTLSIGLLLALSITSVRAEIIESIVAIVNDEFIAQSDLKAFKDKISNPNFNDDLLIPDEKTRKEILENKEKLLQVMINERLIDSEVRRQKLELTVERVAQEIRSIAKRNNMTPEELRRAVESKDMKFSQYQDFIKTSLERHALIDKMVISKIKISEEDVMSEYIRQHGEESQQAFEYTVSHILFLVEKAGIEKARERAENVMAKLKAGEDFDKLASEYSEDPNYTAGGLLGTFKTGETAKEIEQTVVKMSINDTSKVIRTPAGLHILKLNKRKFITDPKTEAVKNDIRAKLYDVKYRSQFAAWLEQTRADAFIRINK